jgi:hypothetical protein
MKNRVLLFIILSISLLIYSCNPLSYIKVETIIPAEIEFPGNFNNTVFVNVANDLNNDNEIDTLLYKIITQEMSYGFMDAIRFSAGIDTSKFLYVKGFPQKEKLYDKDTVSWNYLKNISGNRNADIFIVLDSIKLSMNSDTGTDYYAVPSEYYGYRELAINAYWSIFDLFTKKRLDTYYYGDTLYWAEQSYSKVELKRKMPSVEQTIREASYFAAKDYANRIFPSWQTENRIYYHLGNKDFEKAAEYVKDYKWEEAIRIWEEYAADIDKEIASRACFNLAFANEMLGKMDLAIAWAKQSKSIKDKTRTRYYIAHLESRKQELQKLKKQVY